MHITTFALKEEITSPSTIFFIHAYRYVCIFSKYSENVFKDPLAITALGTYIPKATYDFISNKFLKQNENLSSDLKCPKDFGFFCVELDCFV